MEIKRFRKKMGRALLTLTGCVLACVMLIAAFLPVAAKAETITETTRLVTEVPVTVTGADGEVRISGLTGREPAPTVPSTLPGTLKFAAGETKSFRFDFGQKAQPGDYYYTISQEPFKPGYENAKYTVLARVFYEKMQNGEEQSYVYVTAFTGDYTASTDGVTPDVLEGVKYSDCEFFNISSHDTESFGLQGQTQSGWAVFNPSNPSDPANPFDPAHPFTYKQPVPDGGMTDRLIDAKGTADDNRSFTVRFVDPYSLKAGDDPHDNKKGTTTDAPVIDALDKDGNVVGTYELKTVADEETGLPKLFVVFTPNPGFSGRPQPAVPQAENAAHEPIRAVYQPNVVGPPTPHHAETWGQKGETQNSDNSETTLSFTKGEHGGDFTKIQLLDPRSGKPTNKTTIDALDGNGKKIGTYTLAASDLETGKVTVIFTPDPDFVGDPQPCRIQVTDAYGYTAVATYQPHVVEGEKLPPSPNHAETWGKKGEKQSSDDSKGGKLSFNKGSGEFTKMQLIDPHTGLPTDKKTVDALDKDGKVIGTYTITDINLETGEVTVIFTPDPDFVGDPQPCRIQATDENGFTAVATYQPHVTDEEKPEPPTPPSDDEPGEPGEPPVVSRIKEILPEPIVNIVTGAHTGDESHMMLFGGISLGTLLLLVVFLVKRRRQSEDRQA